MNVCENDGCKSLPGTGFAGLSLSNNPEKTLLDGMPGEDCWYTVGYRPPTGYSNTPAIPAYYNGFMTFSDPWISNYGYFARTAKLFVWAEIPVAGGYSDWGEWEA